MHSKIRVVGATMATVMLLSVVAAPSALGKGRPVKAELTGIAEVSGGDPDGSGYARFRLNHGKRKVCYKIQVNDIGSATAAHIHSGAVGVDGPVEVVLGTPDETGYAEGCVTDVKRSLIKDMRKHRSQYYVNIHNEEFAAGALRGQLKKHAPVRKR